MSTTLTNEEIAVRIQGGETALYAQLWERTKRLWFKLSWKMYSKCRERCISSGVELEDVQQICFFALYDAVQAFDPAKGQMLTAYFTYPFKNHFRAIMHMRTSKREPLNNCASLDEPLNAGETEDIFLIDTIADDTSVQDFEDAEERLFHKQLRDVLETAKQKSLDDMQRDIINAIYYGRGTMPEFARENGLTVSRVRTEHFNGLRNMRRQNPRLKDFAEHYITQHAYYWTGLQSFQNNQGSSQELIVERLIEKQGV